MRKLLILCLFTLPLLSLQSCDKDNDDDNNPSSKSKEVLLTQHTWKMEEILQVENNSQIYYKRGSGTTVYDNDKLTFTADGAGTYTPTPAQIYPITWMFANADKTKLVIVIKFSPSSLTTLNCTELQLTETRFFCVTNFQNGASQPVLASVTRTPL